MLEIINIAEKRKDLDLDEVKKSLAGLVVLQNVKAIDFL